MPAQQDIEIAFLVLVFKSYMWADRVPLIFLFPLQKKPSFNCKSEPNDRVPLTIRRVCMALCRLEEDGLEHKKCACKHRMYSINCPRLSSWIWHPVQVVPTFRQESVVVLEWFSKTKVVTHIGLNLIHVYRNMWLKLWIVVSPPTKEFF